MNNKKISKMVSNFKLNKMMKIYLIKVVGTNKKIFFNLFIILLILKFVK